MDGTGWNTLRDRLRRALDGPHILAFLPALTLGSYWFGGEALLMFVSFLVPAIFAATGGFRSHVPPALAARDRLTDLPWQDSAERHLDELIASDPDNPSGTLCILLAVSGFDDLADRYGPRVCDLVLARLADRLRSGVRDHDLVARSGASEFVVAMKTPGDDPALPARIATRLQTLVAEPIPAEGGTVHVAASAGYATAESAGTSTGGEIVADARLACREALAAGKSGIRMFDPGMEERARLRATLPRRLSDALNAGEFVPWFQPQIDARTGAVTGLEALARWQTPDGAVLGPSAFLDDLARAGLLHPLGAAILERALAALRDWDAAGVHVPRVSVNFSSAELSDPAAVDHVRWALDRFDLTPDRLAIEVLETVIALGEDDAVVRNLRDFSSLGCAIDLDDFGTGRAAIGNIRRFSIGRLKLDRSFVSLVDRDEDQQAVVAAIVTMAAQLGLETVGEGVETPAEHATLARLGCGHVQGYAIAKPMPAGACLDWLRSAAARRVASRPDTAPLTVAHGKTA